MSDNDAAIMEADGERLPRKGQKRAAIIVVVAVVAIFAVLFGWRALRNSAPPPPAPPPTAVVAAVATPTTVPDALEAVGTLRAVREVMLAPEVAGRVAAIRFSGGQYVGAGAALVQLYDGPERADRQAAVARAELARVLLARSRELVPSGANRAKCSSSGRPNTPRRSRLCASSMRDWCRSGWPRRSRACWACGRSILGSTSIRGTRSPR